MLFVWLAISGINVSLDSLCQFVNNVATERLRQMSVASKDKGLSRNLRHLQWILFGVVGFVVIAAIVKFFYC